MGKPFWTRGATRSAGESHFTSAASTAATLPFHGVQVIFSTGAGKIHNLRAPVNIGDQVSLVCRAGTTTKTAMVVLPTGFSFQKTSNSTGATFRKATFNAGNQSLVLASISTSKVAILSNVNTVTIGTS